MSSEHEVDTVWCNEVHTAWYMGEFRIYWVSAIALTQSSFIGDFVIFYWSMSYDKV